MVVTMPNLSSHTSHGQPVYEF